MDSNKEESDTITKEFGDPTFSEYKLDLFRRYVRSLNTKQRKQLFRAIDCEFNNDTVLEYLMSLKEKERFKILDEIPARCFGLNPDNIDMSLLSRAFRNLKKHDRKILMNDAGLQLIDEPMALEFIQLSSDKTQKKFRNACLELQPLEGKELFLEEVLDYIDFHLRKRADRNLDAISEDDREAVAVWIAELDEKKNNRKETRKRQRERKRQEAQEKVELKEADKNRIVPDSRKGTTEVMKNKVTQNLTDSSEEGELDDSDGRKYNLEGAKQLSKGNESIADETPIDEREEESGDEERPQSQKVTSKCDDGNQGQVTAYGREGSDPKSQQQTTDKTNGTYKYLHPSSGSFRRKKDGREFDQQSRPQNTCKDSKYEEPYSSSSQYRITDDTQKQRNRAASSDFLPRSGKTDTHSYGRSDEIYQQKQKLRQETFFSSTLFPHDNDDDDNSKQIDSAKRGPRDQTEAEPEYRKEKSPWYQEQSRPRLSDQKRREYPQQSRHEHSEKHQPDYRSTYYPRYENNKEPQKYQKYQEPGIRNKNWSKYGRQSEQKNARLDPQRKNDPNYQKRIQKEGEPGRSMRINPKVGDVQALTGVSKESVSFGYEQNINKYTHQTNPLYPVEEKSSEASREFVEMNSNCEKSSIRTPKTVVKEYRGRSTQNFQDDQKEQEMIRRNGVVYDPEDEKYGKRDEKRENPPPSRYRRTVLNKKYYNEVFTANKSYNGEQKNQAPTVPETSESSGSAPKFGIRKSKYKLPSRKESESPFARSQQPDRPPTPKHLKISKQQKPQSEPSTSKVYDPKRFSPSMQKGPSKSSGYPRGRNYYQNNAGRSHSPNFAMCQSPTQYAHNESSFQFQELSDKNCDTRRYNECISSSSSAGDYYGQEHTTIGLNRNAMYEGSTESGSYRIRLGFLVFL